MSDASRDTDHEYEPGRDDHERRPEAGVRVPLALLLFGEVLCTVILITWVLR